MAKSMASTDDVEKREWVIACFITLTAVTLAFCLIRTASRLQRGEAGSGFDDFLIGLSWSTSAAMTALTVVGNVRYQFDRHLSDVASDLVTGAIEYAWILNILYLAQTAFAKVSILLFYRRLVQGTYSPRFKWAIWILITIVVVYSLVIFVLYVTECIPISAIWDQYDPAWAAANRRHCGSQSMGVRVAWAAGLMAVLTDFMTALLPSWLFIYIRLPNKAQIARAVIFAFGFLVVIPSVFRLVYLVRAAQPNTDRTWNSLNALIAGKIEGDIGIICACVPCFNIFFQRFFRRHERARSFSGRTGSLAASREHSQTRPSVRSSKSATSDHSTKSVRFEKSILSPNDAFNPSSDAPRVLKWSDRSFDNIPEAYAEDLGRRPRTGDDVESAAAEEHGRKSSLTPMPAAAESWLNLDTDSSDNEREPTGLWSADKSPKTRPHR